MRTVHRLQHILLVGLRRMNRLERIFPVVGIMSGCHIKVLTADMRRHHLLVTVTLFESFSGNLPDASAKAVPFGNHIGNPFPDTFGEHEKFHFLSYLTMVALLGFFQQRQILVQHLLFRERNGIYAGSSADASRLRANTQTIQPSLSRL